MKRIFYSGAENNYESARARELERERGERESERERERERERGSGRGGRETPRRVCRKIRLARQ